MDGGDGCPSVKILLSLNCILSIVKRVTFMLYTFYHTRKNSLAKVSHQIPFSCILSTVHFWKRLK